MPIFQAGNTTPLSKMFSHPLGAKPSMHANAGSVLRRGPDVASGVAASAEVQNKAAVKAIIRMRFMVTLLSGCGDR
jgi:hypothetical protein